MLGATLLAVGRLHSSPADSVERPGGTATDEQTKTQVVEQARHIVAIAGLQDATAGYLLVSCKDRDNPPYQGAVYMDFTLPADTGLAEYFRRIATAMVARGWREGPAPNQHLLGTMLSKDGVAATLYPNIDSPMHGVARIYGQCRDMNNHRGDPTAWVDITNQLY